MQETRGYVDATGETVSQRSKEEASDYRYFPEPDLPPLHIAPETIEALRAKLPELPAARLDRFQSQYGLTTAEARILSDSRSDGDAFEEAVGFAGAEHAKTVAHWFTGDVAKHLNTLGAEAELGDTKVTARHIGELVRLAASNAVTAATAKEVLDVAFETGELPEAIVDARGLRQVTDAGAIDEVAQKAIAANPKAVEDYRAGKQAAIGFLVGQVMREMKGRANANTAAETLRRHLDAAGG